MAQRTRRSVVQRTRKTVTQTRKTLTRSATVQSVSQDYFRVKALAETFLRRIGPVRNGQDYPSADSVTQTVNDSSNQLILPSKTGDSKCGAELLETLSSAGSDGDLARSEFWAKYEETACDFDKRFVSRLEKGVDISMLFAGLFSAVNTAFIIAIQSNIVVADSSNATIANTINAGGLVSSLVWTTGLSYASLTTSLLAAFGTLLAKQWLAHFKATRSIHGSPSSRGIHRQRKFDSMQSWHFNTILDSFPVLLQVSLLLFATSLLGNTWDPYPDVGNVVLAATVVGATLYLVTFFAAILSDDSPFQTLPSQLVRLVLESLLQLPRLFRNLRPSFNSSPNSTFISLGVSTLSEEADAVRWLLQISTDPAVVTAVAKMVPEVDWPVDFYTKEFMEPLWATFKSCFKVQSNDRNAISLSCSDVDRAYACSKALCHLYSEMLYGDYEPDLTSRDLKILASAELCLSSAEDLRGPQEHNFALIRALISLIIGSSTPPASISVPEGELAWVSHIIPAFLHNGNHEQAWKKLAASVISKFAQFEPTPSKVLADHWVIIALIIGIQIDPDDLVKRDKSLAIERLRREVCTSIREGLPYLYSASWEDGTNEDVAFKLDLIIRLLEVERGREMIEEDALDSCITAFYSRLVTGGGGRETRSRPVNSHFVSDMHFVLKGLVASGNAGAVGLILPLWVFNTGGNVNYDLCIDAITLLLNRGGSGLRCIAVHSVTRLLDSSHHSSDFLRCDESAFTALFGMLLDPSLIDEGDRLNIALSYLRAVSAVVDNTSFQSHLLAHVERCIDIQALATVETLHDEHSFLLLSLMASMGTYSEPSYTLEHYPLEKTQKTISSALQYIQSAMPCRLDADRIICIADCVESTCHSPYDVPKVLRRTIKARIDQPNPSTLDLAIVRLLEALDSTHAPPASPEPSPSFTLA